MSEKRKLETGNTGDPADATLGVPMPESSMPTAAPGAQDGGPNDPRRLRCGCLIHCSGHLRNEGDPPTDVALAHSAFAHGIPMPGPQNWTRAEAENALDMRPALEAAPTVLKLSEWLEHSGAHGHLHVAIPVDRAEELLELLTKNSPAAPDGPSAVLTPAVHSTLLEMIGFADAGRCMACGGPLWSPSQSGCHGEHSHGGCVVKFAERHPEHLRWKQRMNVLVLARKYARGEFR